jgi:protein-L-isoaspartate(D-aspartate) O-methyltransferase
VTAVEIDPQCPAQARTNLTSFSNVRVLEGDGTVMSFEAVDIIYVNAGATRPPEPWLDGLAEGRRLILPFTTGDYPNPGRRGAVFRIERRQDEYLARWVSPVGIFPCEGARDPESERALSAAFEKGGLAPGDEALSDERYTGRPMLAPCSGLVFGVFVILCFRLAQWQRLT